MLGDYPGFKSDRVLVLSQRMQIDGKRRDMRMMITPLKDMEGIAQLRAYALERHEAGVKGLALRVCTRSQYWAPLNGYYDYQWVGGMGYLDNIRRIDNALPSE